MRGRAGLYIGVGRGFLLQFELTHYGQTRILANASPQASVGKPAKGASASGSVQTSSKLTAAGPSADVAASADADSYSPEVGVGAASAVAAAAAAGVAVDSHKGDADFDGPDMQGGAEIDVPRVQLDTPDVDVSGGQPNPLLSSPAPACDSRICLPSPLQICS